jgi:hypothetical protein
VGAEEALEVGGGADMRAPAGSEWEREEGERKLGRQRKGGLGCWAARERGREVGRGLGLGLDRFCCFFLFFSNPFQTNFKHILNSNL